MDKINTFITNKKPKTAVVVGAGFIGLEMVEALVHRGLDVHLVELAPQVMIQLEAEIAGFVTKELLDYGVRLHLNTSLQAIKKDSVSLSDGSKIKADLVLLSVGVRPSLQLAKDAGLAIGETGGLLVDEYLQTNDEAIFAAGDMNEITNTISQKKQRVPLAGPANRQGRIAAENALGGKKRYKGSAVSSIVKIFKAHAGSTGLSLKQAKEAGFNADAIVVHKSSHTSYYPGAFRVSLMLIFDKTDGRILGAQAAGRVGVDKRLDVITTAIAGKLKLEELGELDLAYAPPFNSPNGPEQMAAFVAENHRIGFSPSILAQNLEDWVLAKSPIIFDIRDPISYSRAHLSQTNNLSQGQIQESLDSLPKDSALLVISEDGQKGHILTRMLLTKGYSNVLNLSGGYISLERQERAKPFEKLRVGLHAIEKKSIQKSSESHEKKASEVNTAVEKTEGPLIIDVRTPMEFKMGAVPGAIHADLDSLEEKIPVITKNDFNREIILYCASGARSSYGVRILKGLGYTNVTNGGGLHTMMSRFA
jgi:rhodanese-related sulfurtransferase